MSVTDNRIKPLVRALFYTPGQGDQRNSRHQFNWYSVLAQNWQYGAFSLNANAIPLLEFLPDCGLVCRAFPTPQDTRLSQYVTGLGSWEEERPATGVPRKYRLVQYGVTADIAWSATTTYTHPGDPSFFATFALPDSPADHNPATFPPYVRLEFGGGTWAIHFPKDGSPVLLRNVGGTWGAVLEIPSPTRNAYGDIEEFGVIVRCHRGRIFISTDYGKSYVWFAGSVPAGKLTWRGQGGQAIMGLHQILYVAGTFTSQGRNTLELYTGATPVIDGVKTTPGATTVTFSDQSVFASYEAKLRATLTPAAVTGTPFNWYSSPELYATRYRIANVTTPGFGGYSLPFDGEVTSVRREKPRELDQSRLTLTVRKDPDSPFVWAHGRYEKVSILYGNILCDGSESWLPFPYFVGYVEPLSVSSQEYRSAEISLTLLNPSIRLKRKKWSRQDRIPLGGQSLNAALDDILTGEAIPLSQRAWHTRGDTFILPFGSPENPFEWPPDGECKWETVTRLCGYAGLEVGVSDDGLFYSERKNYVTPSVIQTLEADPISLLETAVTGASLRMDCSQGATAVIVTGEAEDGQELVAAGFDYTAEQNTLSARFSGLGRETELDEVSGTVTAGVLALRAQSIAEEVFTLPFEPDLSLPVNLDLSRRDRVRITGLTHLGFGLLDEWVVLTLSDTIDPMIGNCETTAGLVRI